MCGTRLGGPGRVHLHLAGQRLSELCTRAARSALCRHWPEATFGVPLRGPRQGLPGGVQGQVAAAVAVEGGETGAVAALRAALGTVLAGVRGALADGTLQCAEELPDTAAAAAAAAQAHRAELLARLAALREVRAVEEGRRGQ